MWALKEGMVVEFASGMRYYVRMVNEFRANVVPYGKKHVQYLTDSGKEVDFYTVGHSIDISNNSEVKILFDPTKNLGRRPAIKRGRKGA